MNENQLEAIFNVNGPLIVLAGAGSGKTTVIINRIANMIKFGNAYMSDETPEPLTDELIDDLQNTNDAKIDATSLKSKLQVNPVHPWNILAITFTNKAANELKSRLSKAVGEQSSSIWASTFHSMCAKLLRIHADKIGYSNHFTVYDADDTKRLIKDCQKNLKIDDKILSYKSIAYEISRAKDELVDAEKFKQNSGGDFRLSHIAEVYEIYQNRLKEADAMDFDDLIFNTVHLFKTCPDILKKYQDKFKYILVDEYQDTNYAQYCLIKMLAKKHKNLCVVGDDDQSIYKFRGATIENIMNFEKNYPGAKIIRLEQNYRSTQNILDAANSVIQNNSRRKGKTLWTQNKSGDKIKVHTAYSEHDEANYMAEAIQNYVAQGGKYSDCAILYRMNSQSNVIEKIFIKSGIPYRILGGVRFYERQEIRDMIAYLSVINNPNDEIRLRRIINQPRRSIGERTIAQAAEIAIETNTNLLDIIRDSDKHENLQRISIKLKAFSGLIDNLIAEYKDGSISIHELYNIILEQTEYINFLKTSKENSESRIENVRELASNILKYETDNGENATLAGFLEEVSLLTDIDNYDADSDSVVMMTMHSAKGLEFPIVFLPGFEEGIFPGFQSIIDESEIEEERRLAYVGITRAKNKLNILNSDSRMIFGSTSHNKASRFLGEIPENLIEKTKSRDWKKLDASEEKPRSAQELRVKSTLAARFFGQVAGGKSNDSENKIVFAPGDNVKHPVFGEGTILATQKMGNDHLLEITFSDPKIGIKKLMSNFARLKKTEEN